MVDVLEALPALEVRVPEVPVGHGLEGLGAARLQPPPRVIPVGGGARGTVLQAVIEDPIHLEGSERLLVRHRLEGLEGIRG